MQKSDIDLIFKLLRKKGISIGKGLDIRLMDEAERNLGFKFPGDLKDLLLSGVPIGERFPKWNDDIESEIVKTKDFIKQAFLFDVTSNGFWHETFGPKPNNIEEAAGQLEENIHKVPMLLPVYGHRFLPTVPSRVNNPVISMVQPTDIIIYGENLKQYFINEFGNEKQRNFAVSTQTAIPFWGDLIE